MITSKNLTENEIIDVIVKTDRNVFVLSEDKVDPAKDIVSSANRFTTKPKCIVVMDSVNNPYFPIPEPRLDTYKPDIIKIRREYRRLYGHMTTFLPWHYVVESIAEKYVVFVGRPLDLKFPVNDDGKWSNGVFTISDAITILIIGDSTSDVYVQQIYDVVGRMCIAPLIRIFKILEQNVFPINLSDKFKFHYMRKFMFQR